MGQPANYIKCNSPLADILALHLLFLFSFYHHQYMLSSPLWSSYLMLPPPSSETSLEVAVPSAMLLHLLASNLPISQANGRWIKNRALLTIGLLNTTTTTTMIGFQKTNLLNMVAIPSTPCFPRMTKQQQHSIMLSPTTVTEHASACIIKAVVACTIRYKHLIVVIFLDSGSLIHLWKEKLLISKFRQHLHFCLSIRPWITTSRWIIWIVSVTRSAVALPRLLLLQNSHAQVTVHRKQITTTIGQMTYTSIKARSYKDNKWDCNLSDRNKKSEYFAGCPHQSIRIYPPKFVYKNGMLEIQTKINNNPPRCSSHPTESWNSSQGRYAQIVVCTICHSDSECILEVNGPYLKIEYTCYRDLGPGTSSTHAKWLALTAGEGSPGRQKHDLKLYARLWNIGKNLSRPGLNEITHQTPNGLFNAEIERQRRERNWQ